MDTLKQMLRMSHDGIGLFHAFYRHIKPFVYVYLSAKIKRIMIAPQYGA